MAIKSVTVSTEEVPWNMYPPGWPETLKLNYQENAQNIVQTAEVANEANVTSNKQKDRNDEQDLLISENTAAIEKNALDIEKNAEDIKSNSDSNSEVKGDLEAHENSISAHGVTGNNVGTLDYASTTTGGVVLSSVNIQPVTLLSVNVTGAPDDYDKVYIQNLADAINDLATNQQAIAAKIESMLDAQKDAKQMQPNP